MRENRVEGVREEGLNWRRLEGRGMEEGEGGGIRTEWEGTEKRWKRGWGHRGGRAEGSGT